ncbi:hypothetical protein [Phenylobacterium aquaticum]|uniref:hypothetical protein n=1 Tax=Phenylobacterium aquaticum TaxID=1763816 RepID=UPI0026E9DC58|nr:hypothetical protein [Phenylobacterium aquaticum]
MTAQYTAFSRPAFSAADFERDEPAAEAGTFAPTPIYAREGRSTAGRRLNPALWAIVPVAALAIGIGAYVMNTPKDNLLVSTAPPPAQLAETPAAPIAAPTDVRSFKSEAAPSAVAKASVVKAAPSKAAAPKVRLAGAAPSVATASRDASATIPAAPQPYAASAQVLAPAPVIEAAPPPAVVTPDPAPAPTPEAATPQV